MYTDYFGFREGPFQSTPNPRFFYSAPSYQEVEGSILRGLEERQGFVVLTGEAGVGKTTFLRKLMAELEGKVHGAYLFNTSVSFEELLVFACMDFGIEIPKDAGRGEVIKKLNAFLIERARAGEAAAIFIDEAQNLPRDVLEYLRLLTNLEVDQQSALQIVMVGQPELEEKLNRPDLRQVKQRVAIRSELKCLTDKEVQKLIQFRLENAGCERKDLFAPQALQAVAHFSRGLPGLANQLCDGALRVCMGFSWQTVTPDMVRQVADELGLKTRHLGLESEASTPPDDTTDSEFEGRTPRKWVLQVGSLAAVCLLSIGLAFLSIGTFSYIANPKQFNERLAQEQRRVRMLLNVLMASPESLITSKSAPDNTDEVAIAKVPTPAFLPPLDGPNNHSRSSNGDTAVVEASPTVPAVARIEPLPVGSDGEESNESAQLINDGIVADVDSSTTVEQPEIASEEKVSPSSNSELLVRTIESVVIQPGTTISGIFSRAYGRYAYIAMGLVKEVNPHIEDLHRVRAGEILNLPVIDRNTLLRKSGDGTYRLVVAAYRSSSAANQLAQTLQPSGFRTQVVTKKMASGVSLHRVEILDLTPQEIDAAWQLFHAAKMGDSKEA